MIYHNYFENSISLQIITPISSSFRLVKLARRTLWVLGVTWWCTGFITSREELHGTNDLMALGTHYPKETDGRGFGEQQVLTYTSFQHMPWWYANIWTVTFFNYIFVSTALNYLYAFCSTSCVHRENQSPEAVFHPCAINRLCLEVHYWFSWHAVILRHASLAYRC